MFINSNLNDTKNNRSMSKKKGKKPVTGKRSGGQPCSSVLSSENAHKQLPLAISTNTNPKVHLHESVKLFAQNGYKNIELQLEHVAKNDHRDPFVIRELALIQHDYNLGFSGHASYVTTNLASTDEIERTKSIEKVKQEMYFFACFKAEMVTVHTGRGVYEQNFATLCESLKELMDYGDDLGVRIDVETAGRKGFLLLTPEQYLELHNLTGCNLTLDLPHLMTTHPDPINYWQDVKQLIPMAKNVHISDTFMPEHLHNPIGYGNFVTEKLLIDLVEAGYKGQVVIDAAEKGYSPEMYIRQGLAFAKSTSYLIV